MASHEQKMLLIFVIPVTVFLFSCSKEPLPLKKIAIPHEFYEVINNIEEQRASGEKETSPRIGQDDLAEQMERQLDRHTQDVWIRLNLAYVYDIQRKYRQSLDHYLIAHAQAPEVADPLIGLGRVCYELTLIDMIQRKIVKSHSTGFLIFVPDERARFMLEHARKFLLEAKSKKQLTRVQGGAVVTISPPGAADEFLEMIEEKMKMR